MTVETIITWNPIPDETVKTQIQTKAAEMAAQGKTDDVVHNDCPNGYPNPPLIAIRTWATQADAEEWLAWINTLPVLPESTQIVS